MSTLPTPPPRGAWSALRVAAIVATSIIIAITWSDIAAGLGLAVAVLAWWRPRSPRG